MKGRWPPEKNLYFYKYSFLFFLERYTARKKKLYIRPHRNDDTKITKVHETGKKKNTSLFLQFYKFLIWESQGKAVLRRGEHILIAMPVLYWEFLALFSHGVKNSQASVCRKNKKTQTKRFRTDILR